MSEMINSRSLPGAVLDNVSAIGDAAVAGMEKGLSATANALGTVRKIGARGAIGLNNGVVAAGARISDSINNGAENISGVIGNNVENALGEIKTIGSDGKRGITRGLNTAKSALSSVGNVLSKTSEAFGTGVNLFGVGVRGTIGGLAEGITTIGGAVFNKANTMAFNSSVSLNKWSGTVLGSVGKISADWLDDEKNTIKENLRSMKDNFRENVSSLGSNVSNGVQTLKEGFRKKISALGASLQRQRNKEPENMPKDTHQEKTETTPDSNREKEDTQSTTQEPQQSGQADTKTQEKDSSAASQKSESTPSQQNGQQVEETKPKKVLQRTEEDIKRRAELQQNLNELRTSLAQKRKQFNKVQGKITEISGSISEMEQKNPNLATSYDTNYKKISAAIEEYRNEIAEATESAKIGGNKLPNFGPPEGTSAIKKYSDEIARRAFKDEILAASNGDLAPHQITAVSHYLEKEKLMKLNNMKDKLAEEIKPMINAKGGFSARGALRAKQKADIAAKSGGWKGKAAIFGGIAASALAAVGVASMMMSGGRQENSNLYNPYQAMY